MLQRFIGNHVFANLAFVVVLAVGLAGYLLLPRQQDPEMNFNWINVVTVYPGAGAEEVEKLVTDPFEEAIRKVSDIRFVSSNSREGVSTLLIRFQELSSATFDKRMNDLRREIRNRQRELPEGVEDPLILEITSANGFPTAMVAVQGTVDDEHLRRQVQRVKKDLERIPGVDAVNPLGLRQPELQVRFDPGRLDLLGLTPVEIADALRWRFQDRAGGIVAVGESGWQVRAKGIPVQGREVLDWSVTGHQGGLPGEVALRQVASVVRTGERARQLVSLDGQPAVLLLITKQGKANSLQLVERIRTFLSQRNALAGETGVQLALVDDRTYQVEHALYVMESNALLGLCLVLLCTWIFLGSHLALLVSLGVPFALAGAFGILYGIDSTLNVMVLLGVVIALGMLVDDTVVITEAIHQRLQRGDAVREAVIGGVREVAAPVLSSVLTTVAAFLPLMLLPGILGMFMRIIPMVVTMALLISLVEAFWMLPAHIIALGRRLERRSYLDRWRRAMLGWLRRVYSRLLVRVMRRPLPSLLVTLLPMVVAVGVVAGWRIPVDFFAMDPLPLFYINVEMPPDSTLSHTMRVTREVEGALREGLRPGELQSMVAYAGQMLTDTEPYFGDRYGQVLVTLQPDASSRRSVAAIMAECRERAAKVAGPERVWAMKLSGGPPQGKPINIKVRGDDFDRIMPAVEALKAILLKIPAVSEVTDDASPGRGELVLRLNDDAARRAGVTPMALSRTIRLLTDGEEVASFQEGGEKVVVRVLATPGVLPDLDSWLQTTVALPGGGTMPLGHLTVAEKVRGKDAIRHYNYLRSVTVQAELDREVMDVVTANWQVQAEWERQRALFPGVDLDFSGILDDIEESISAIVVLFVLGIGLIYMILGAQFQSYWQPLMILATVPVAFTGVVYGLLLSGHPLSLYTLYGVVALSGITVNSSIVLIAAANDRLALGMSLLHSILFAARRRLVSILITTTTTVSGLLSLAMGWGGYSLMWGPVATAIVWGLTFSTLLTLFLVPLLYVIFMTPRWYRGGRSVPVAAIVTPNLVPGVEIVENQSGRERNEKAV